MRFFGYLVFVVLWSTWAAAADRPNVLFLSIDDLRPELGCYGAEAIHSPHIDRLAESGVRFDRAYCQLAVCNPSRVSLLTGLRPDSARVWTLDVRFRHTVPDVVTLPQHFKQSGYDTVSFGKIFHNPWPDNVSWSEPHRWPEEAGLWSKEARQRLARFREKMKSAGKSEAAIRRMRAPAVEIVDVPDSEHIDGAIADQALEAMRRLAETDKPFFLAAGFVRPHLPFVVPRQYWELYDRESIPLAKNGFLPKDSPRFAMNTMYELRDYMDYADAPDPRDGSLTEAQQRELKHGYYASVSFIDAQVGRLLGELEALDLAKNTIVILWSDHGWKLGEHNSWCKQSNYEVDTRVPLVIRDPRAGGNRRECRALVELLDVYPTLCELAGIPVPAHVEGDSLVSLLNDPGESVKQAAFSQFRRKLRNRDLMGYSMRTDRFRYVEWTDRHTREAVAFELYDHEADPAENVNLAGRSEWKDQLMKFGEQLWETLPKPPSYREQPSRKQVRPTMKFQNRREETLLLSWIPKGGKPERLAKIAPRESIIQNTTKGHVFLVEGAQSEYRKTVTVSKDSETIVLREGEVESPPNILFLMADDWSFPHAGALGDPVVKTPTFDRLAREGVLFKNAFVCAPSCTPSRHSVASGQYHWRLGDGVNLGGSLSREIPVYPELLAEAGYVTGFSRKGTAPSKHRFRDGDPFGPRFQNFEAFYANRKPGKPFCFWNGAGEPHRPYQWGSGKENGIELGAIEVPACLPDNEVVRTDLADYYDRVQRFDRDAARILSLIEKKGELENTIVVMSGDNGMPFPRCKATLYDLGTRVPLAIRWGKRVLGGRTLGDFVSLTDVAPTFLEAAGLTVPNEMTGRSLLRQLLATTGGQIDPERDHVLAGMERHVQPNPSRAIRTADFLYIRNFAPAAWPDGRAKGEQPHYDFTKTPWPTTPGAFSHNVDPGPTKQWMRENAGKGNDASLVQLAFGKRPSEELYDLTKDPDQMSNVVNEAGYRSVRDRLSRRLATELRESGDPRFEKKGFASFDVEGWTVHLNELQWNREPEATGRMLDLLVSQLQRVVEAVPPRALRQLREVPIWINPTYPELKPTAEYHPEVGWLKRNNRLPEMAKSIEITNVSIFPFEDRRMPYLLLHELSHAYHDRVLGFDRADVIEAFTRARDSGSYDLVKRFNGKNTVMDKAYAMANAKEYFAEVSEAYFGKNDFFPFTREELRRHDPQVLKVLEKAWGVQMGKRENE